MTKIEEAVKVGLVRALVQHGRIETSETRAKAVQPFVDKLVKRAKQNSVAARRLILARLKQDKETTTKLFNEVAPRFKDRPSGFTRWTRLGTRRGDASARVKLEWVEGRQEKSEA